MTINQIQNEIIEEFSSLDDWMDRYQLLIDMGNDLPPLAEAHKTPNNIIEGCQSRVWITATTQPEGVMHFQADSDALIVKGIIALLLRIFNGQKDADILNADLYFVPKVGLQEHLSPTRANGLVAMIQRIKLLAQQSAAQRS